jgi:hypothetical protein
MSVRKRISTSLWVAALVLLAIGQWQAWRAPNVDTRGFSVLGPQSETEPNTPSTSTRLDFDVLRVDSRALGRDNNQKQAVRVLLHNRLNRDVIILGATTGCHPAGCWEAVGFPRKVGPGGDVTIEFEVKWITTPIRPVPITVFTNVSLSEQLELSLLPTSATLKRTRV